MQYTIVIDEATDRIHTLFAPPSVDMALDTTFHYTLRDPKEVEIYFGLVNQFLNTLSLDESSALAGDLSLILLDLRETTSVEELDNRVCPKLASHLATCWGEERQLFKKLEQFLKLSFPEEQLRDTASMTKLAQHGVALNAEEILQLHGLVLLCKLLAPVIGAIAHRYRQLGLEYPVDNLATCFNEILGVHGYYWPSMRAVYWERCRADAHVMKNPELPEIRPSREQLQGYAIPEMLIRGLPRMKLTHFSMTYLRGCVCGYMIGAMEYHAGVRPKR